MCKSKVAMEATKLADPNRLRDSKLGPLDSKHLFEKQSSFYFQAKSAQNLIQDNIFFHGPRAGMNFNDGFGGSASPFYCSFIVVLSLF